MVSGHLMYRICGLNNQIFTNAHYYRRRFYNKHRQTSKVTSHNKLSMTIKSKLRYIVRMSACAHIYGLRENSVTSNVAQQSVKISVYKRTPLLHGRIAIPCNKMPSSIRNTAVKH